MQFTGSIPLELMELTDLEVFELSDNLLTGFIPSEIGLLKELGEWNCGGRFERVPCCISNFAYLESSVYLGTSRNELRGPLPSTIGLLTKLGTNLTDTCALPVLGNN